MLLSSPYKKRPRTPKYVIPKSKRTSFRGRGPDLKLVNNFKIHLGPLPRKEVVLLLEMAYLESGASFVLAPRRGRVFGCRVLT